MALSVLLYGLDRAAQKEAKEAGYYIRLFYVGLDTVQESLKRIQNRVEKGGHDIPPDDVKRRFSGRFEALAKVLPYCDEAIFFDNENGFQEVGEYRNGELIPFGDSPEWFYSHIIQQADEQAADKIAETIFRAGKKEIG